MVSGVLGYLFPLRCFAFTHVVSVPFCTRILYLGGSSSVFLGGVQPSPPVSRLSLGWPTRAISILQLSLFCSVLGGSALRVFLLLAFDPLGWLLVLSPYPWSSHSFCWSVPTLPSWSVGPPGSPRLALPLRSGVLLPGCACCVFGLYLFGFLPFLLLRCLTAWWLFPLGGCLLYGCLRSLVPRSSTVVLSSVACLQSGFPTLVVVLLFPPSSFRTPSVSVGCVPSAFAMGSP